MNTKDIFIEVFKKYLLQHSVCKKFYEKQFTHSKYSIENILTAIFYVLKTGIAWRDLTLNIQWNSAYYHFSRLCKTNVFTDFFTYLRNLYTKQHSYTIQIIDSTFIQNKFGKQHIGRNKFFKSKNGNKVSLVTDEHGIPISIYVGLGNLHDLTIAEHHYTDFYILTKKKHRVTLLADKGYVSKKFQSELSKYNYDLMVPKKTNMRNYAYLYDSQLYKKRVTVEHTFAKFKCYKRIQLRYDSMFLHYLSFVNLAFSLLIIQKLY